jgi:hypothetical protein
LGPLPRGSGPNGEACSRSRGSCPGERNGMKPFQVEAKAGASAPAFLWSRARMNPREGTKRGMACALSCERRGGPMAPSSESQPAPGLVSGEGEQRDIAGSFDGFHGGSTSASGASSRAHRGCARQVESRWWAAEDDRSRRDAEAPVEALQGRLSCGKRGGRMAPSLKVNQRQN